LGLRPDLRYWVTPRFALDFGLELLVARGTDTIDVKASYFEHSAGSAFSGAFVRGNVGL
jgi:hypothetical protein